MSVATTVLVVAKSPAENKMPVVLPGTVLPPSTIKQPATVAEPVIVKLAGVDVVLALLAAVENTGATRAAIAVISAHAA